MRGLFVFSKIPVNNSSYLGFPDDLNKGKVGFFKDEFKGNSIIEFVVMKKNMYFFIVCECQTSHSNMHPQVWDKQIGKGIARATLNKLPTSST